MGGGVGNTCLQGSSGSKLVCGNPEGVKALGTNLAAGQHEAWIAWYPGQEDHGKQPPGVQVRPRPVDGCMEGVKM